MLPSLLTILIVDDQALIRAAISQVLTSQPEEIECIAMAQNYAEAEQQTAHLRPQIIWLDLHIAHAQGYAEIARLRKLSPDSRILALTDVEDEQEAFAAIMDGAQGYLSKQDVNPEEIMTIIHKLCSDEFVFRPALLARLLRYFRAAAVPLWGSKHEAGRHLSGRIDASNGLGELTLRERQVLQLASLGYRNREIAQKLHVSEKTIQKHVQSILSKLDVQNRTEAAYLVHRQSIA